MMIMMMMILQAKCNVYTAAPPRWGFFCDKGLSYVEAVYKITDSLNCTSFSICILWCFDAVMAERAFLHGHMGLMSRYWRLVWIMLLLLYAALRSSEIRFAKANLPSEFQQVLEYSAITCYRNCHPTHSFRMSSGTVQYSTVQYSTVQYSTFSFAVVK